ncbi:peptidoglycan DD-metalloendopeptidase family protein [Clostridium estertheticum]|uniref:M23 family metallopeptidase n=1 Tax=Clostridium estertheticum TaxID=238834 RepID=UPI0013EE90DE|nr:M23 family metallopeptidase [Clostridium estertheticum]MBZ9609732.1 peptidoglycan DD-metalloendopeptidase family protein [Clostridium estertheticum]
MNALKRNKMNISVVIITLMITATMVYLNVYRFYGYKVCIGSSTITFVKNKNEFNKTYKELQSEIKSKYGNVITIKGLTLGKVKVNDDAMFISGDYLKKVMLKKSNVVVDVFLMKSDNRKMAYVTNENQGKEILNSVKDYYSEGSKLNSIIKTDIENKISYEPVKVKTGNLYENNEIIKELIKYNNKAQVPLITVKTVGNIIKEQAIYPTTIIKSSSKLMNGVKKVGREGSDGMKKVTTEVIAINNNIISEKVLKEDTITPAQNKEILVGTNNPITPRLEAINSPSRGSISSRFGARWGKMHKGVDIAASFGATISAALDGSVTYAAWQDGYGNVIKINHGGGIETTYAHCSVITVKKGEVVKGGMKIGEVGSTGNSTGPHLHFEVRENGEPKNPQKYIK